MNEEFDFDDRPARLSVSELNREARRLLEQGLSRLWVEGEVSNLARPASGHVYFTLKDADAQLRCAWFRQRQRGPTIGLSNGDQVLAFGKVSIYEARGDYQLIVERVNAAGEGELRLRFDRLRKKLEAEGLFDEANKSTLPLLPRRIGIVTSPTGAAIRDILTVLRRRFPMIPVVIYPAAVQGDRAAAEIAAALATANRRAETDVLIVGRGGGSLEDLWPFNEERVARAVYDSAIPVVSGVGHESDFTITDFVADLRAPTPSGAAELVAPDQRQWFERFDTARARMTRGARRRLDDSAQALDWLAQRLARGSPASTVTRQRAWLQNLRQMLGSAMRHRLIQDSRQLERQRAALHRQSPALGVQRTAARVVELRRALETAARSRHESMVKRLAIAARGLHSVSPLATLERGYAVVTDADSGRLLTNADDVAEGSDITAKLAHGELLARVLRRREGSS